MRKATIYEISFNENREKVQTLLKATELIKLIKNSNRDKILIKPNLVNASPPPITTPYWLVKELVKFLKENLPGAEIIIADGTGELDKDTLDLFEIHGYFKHIKGVKFLDLNYEPCIEITLKNGKNWDKMHLPEVIFKSFLISVPVLKAHTLASVTLSMKNMIGVCPPKYYQQGGHWKKSAFHQNIHEAIFDLNCARCPDFVLLDATVGMASSHLSGPKCNPPINKILASFDPVAIDAYGATLLGKNWQDIGHIYLADGILGNASNYNTIKVKI